MNDKTKGINILSEKEKIKYCCGQRNPKLDFLDICFHVVGGRNSFLCRDENKCDWSFYGAKPVQWAGNFFEQIDLQSIVATEGRCDCISSKWQ